MAKLLSPSTGESIPSVPSYTPEESIPKIFEQARKAQGQWAELSYRERSVYIYRIRDFVKQNAERIASLVSQCNGKTRVDAFATEVVPAILSCTWYAKNTSKVLAREKISPGHFLFLNKGYYVDHEPLGIVGIISPWNYPFSIPFGEVIMGLMAGNAIVLKVGTPVVPIGALIEECIAAARLPTGLFTHVNISGAKVSQLFLSNKINKIFFTGSVNVGKQLMKEAADTLTPLSLELGGKDPMIICEDADLERAVNCVCWGGFQNAGQSCGGVERIYVHRSRFDDFVKMLCNKTECLRHGPSDTTFDVDIGAMTTSSQLKIIQNQVADAVKRGARIAAQSRAVGDCSQGYFYPATVLLDVTSDMTIMKEETFGPVLPVMMFDTVEEALRLANDNCMALTAGVFSCNMKNAQKIASALHAGVVTINDHLYTHGMAETPWGGWKDSGLGRTHGSHGLKEMCNAKCVSYERIPCFLIPRNLWWYPFDFATYNCLRSLVGVLAPSSLGDFFFSLAKALPCAAEKMFTPWTNSKFSTNTVSNRTFFATFSIVIVVSMVSTVKFIAALITSSTKVQNA